MNINGIEFDWTDEYISKNGGLNGFSIRKHDIGVIAQEIEKVMPEIVVSRQDNTKAVRYEKIVALLIEGIKEQQHEINKIKKNIGM